MQGWFAAAAVHVSTVVLLLQLAVPVAAVVTAATPVQQLWHERATAAVAPLQRKPQIHFAPPCFTVAPPHDIAAALWHPETQVYHMFPGCWHATPVGGWQVRCGAASCA